MTYIYFSLEIRPLVCFHLRFLCIWREKQFKYSFSSFDSVSLKLCDQLLDTQTVPKSGRSNEPIFILGNGYWDKNGQICSILFYTVLWGNIFLWLNSGIFLGKKTIMLFMTDPSMSR